MLDFPDTSLTIEAFLVDSPVFHKTLWIVLLQSPQSEIQMILEGWFVFCVVWFAATIPLGPNALNCVYVSMTNGFCYSLWAVLGILAASICHMAAMTLGIATILLANAALFTVLKWCGVVYLAWMGFSLFRTARNPIPLGHARRQSPGGIARRGFTLSMTNPKAILSYSAVLPQLIDPAKDAVAQLLALAPTALIIIFAVYMIYGALGSFLGRWLATPHLRTIFNRGVGGFYILCALGLASFEPHGQGR